MRILFAYFDFTVSTDNTLSPRPLGECALNFSTTHNYTVEKKKGEPFRYIVSRTDKPEHEKIPEGFWGDRIYNVTAIVGENGTGKSTIIHSLIKSILKGYKPVMPMLLGVPFLLASVCFPV